MVVWFEGRGHHAVPAHVNAVHNAILRHCVRESGGDAKEFGISAYVHPLEETVTRPVISEVYVEMIMAQNYEWQFNCS